MAKRPKKLKGAASRKRSSGIIDTQKVLSHLEWQSSEPIGFSDRDLGPAHLEARGVYSIRIVDPGAFQGEFKEPEQTPDGIRTHLQGRIVARFDDLLKRRVHSIRDLPGLTNDLATEVRLEIKEDFSRWGIHLIDFFVTALVPTRDFQKVIDGHAMGSENGNPARSGNGNGNGSGSRIPTGTSNGLRPDAASRRRNGMILPEAMVGEGPCPRCGHAVPDPCRECGSSVPHEARFCPGCGASQA